MYKITHPRPQAGRQREFGVDFTDGVAFVKSLHPVRLQAFKQHRFRVTPWCEWSEPESKMETYIPLSKARSQVAMDRAAAQFAAPPETGEGDSEPKTSKPRKPAPKKRGK
ncbi:hypothetical protein [Paramicrobacterium agarici]|uniref:hypothetical protein n=1 Tax=Paramicrobacterium agarici TaxID=630514 RepID=UPI00114D880E|nr:hypothetical protein [Microbacterium agarici]TQO23788.1 hypothetical protein FB385_2649 [Microbacterium agarici]